ncbi:hypothetical protein AgCh_017155 [Apium graveolens]
MGEKESSFDGDKKCKRVQDRTQIMLALVGLRAVSFRCGRFSVTAIDYKELDITAIKPKPKAGMLCEADMDNGNLSRNPSEYYTTEDLQSMEDATMGNLAGMFSNIRFRGKQGFRDSGSRNHGQRSSSSSGSGYKTGIVDGSKFRCYNCDEVGHFALE